MLCLADCELAELNLSGFTGLEHLDLLGTKTKLTGSFQKTPSILCVDSAKILNEVLPDVEKEARECCVTEADESPPFSLTIGSNLRED